MSNLDDKYDRLYDKEPWAALARQMGMRPGQTESQARSALAFAADLIADRDRRIAMLEAALVAAGINPGRAIAGVPAEVEDQTAADASAHGPEIEIDTIGGNCPVQAEGRIDGEPFYFRARGSSWSIGIGGEPVGEPDWSHEEEYGSGYDAGWMSEDEAREFISQAASAWAARNLLLDAGQDMGVGP